MQQTAGPEYVIGKARLNGFNGMQGMPTIGLKIYLSGLRVLPNIISFC